MKRSVLWIPLCVMMALVVVVVPHEVPGAQSAPPVATPALEPPPGATRVRPIDGAVMVYVPAGEFLMGSPTGEGNANEWPQHTVYVDAFWIDRTEVTNRQFERFVRQTGYRTDAEKEAAGWVVEADHPDGWLQKGADWRHPEGPESDIVGREEVPVVQVSWNDAMAYCRSAGARLPTEAEWEKAARGTDGRRYPWGDQEPSCEYAVMRDESGPACGQGWRALPVGSRPAGASPYGVLDMAGNVWETLADAYDPDYHIRFVAGSAPGVGAHPLFLFYVGSRGGSWYDRRMDGTLASAYRGGDGWQGNSRTSLDGFRCAVSVPAAVVEAAAAPAGLAPASRALFVGDSASWFLDRYLPRLAASGKVAVESKALAENAAGLGVCVDVLIYPREMIQSGNWNVVVLEQDLDSLWRLADRFCEDVGKLQKLIAGAGAQTVLYMPWDNATVPPPPTLQQTADLYTQCGAQLGIKVAPVGLAFERAAQQRPALELYTPDGKHASLRGEYLALCVLYATLFERSPVGLGYRMEDVAPTYREYALWGLGQTEGWQLSAEEASFLQTVAWETLQDYQAGR